MPKVSSIHATQTIHARGYSPLGEDSILAPRAIVLRTGGEGHGPIVRVFSPSDIGRIVKPFVFLDYVDFNPRGGPLFRMHPHSGIATITILLSGDIRYEDTTGASGLLQSGSVEWMNAGGGVWHDGYPEKAGRLRAYQLWITLPEELENGPAQSQYLPPDAVPHVGPARLILGEWAGRRSPVLAPPGTTYLHVTLPSGARWRYAPPRGHAVAWAHVSIGTLVMAGTRVQNELVVFEESNSPIDMTAEGEVEFVLGSAMKHPHDLVLGSYSVHTSAAALRRGEAEIERIGQDLRRRGRI
jgi:redox-sensitive bicupin YhaK (pirin superfamily)